MDMSTVKNAVFVLLLCGTAYTAYTNRKQLLRFFMRLRKRSPKKGNAMAQVSKSFLMYADNFQGLFETMYKASIGTISYERMRNVLREWDIRMGGIAQAPIVLRSWWAVVIADFDSLSDGELQERAKSVVRMILSSGIIRDERRELTASQDTVMFYQTSDEVGWKIGQTLCVESPCWYIQSNPVRIIEKGYCRIL